MKNIFARYIVEFILYKLNTTQAIKKIDVKIIFVF